MTLGLVAFRELLRPIQWLGVVVIRGSIVLARQYQAHVTGRRYARPARPPGTRHLTQGDDAEPEVRRPRQSDRYLL
jgi:hypothetical protein